MKISKNWIMEWTNFKLGFKKICNSLIKLGIEIDILKKVPICLSKYIFIGKIILKKKIFLDNDFFFLYSILIRENKILKIFSKYSCNIGEKFIVSISKNIFSEQIFFYIKKYHHKKSKCFFCAPFSIGISNIIEKPLKLSNSSNINASIKNYIKIYDNIIKLNIPHNRLNELNIIGISREICAFNKIEFCNLYKNYIKKKYKKNKIEVFLEKDIKNYCYLGRCFNNLNVNVKTPFWIINKLNMNGIKSKDIISNIINYVFIETGETFHFFNKNSYNNKIFVKILKNSSKIYLFNKNFFLKKNNIVICNEKKILIFGNNFQTKYVNFSSDTKNIFLGSLFLKNNRFNNYNKNNVNSNKINYFSYSNNFNMQLFSLNYITKIILRICGGSVNNILKIKDFDKYMQKKIILNKKKIKKIIGYYIDDHIIEEKLKILGYKFFKKDNMWKVLVPYWRDDIFIEEDIISDIIRIYDVNKIFVCPPSEKFNITCENFYKNNFFKEIKNFLICKGYNEVINYSFIDENNQKNFSNNEKYIKIKNPISKNMSVMRTSLLPGLFKNFIYNNNRQNSCIKIFELGKCYFKNENNILGVNEKTFLSGLSYGSFDNIFFDTKEKKIDFYDLKGDVEHILEISRSISNVKFFNKSFSGFDNIISSSIYLDKKYIGKIGKLDQKILKKNNYKKNYDIFLFELCLENFYKKEILYVKKISEYPSIKRDISIIVLNNVKCFDIISFCKKIFSKNLIDIYIFDFYFGVNIPFGKKSISIRLIFQSLKKTLKDVSIDKIIFKNMVLLEKKFNAVIKRK
ncbi:phenylalanine--tRNA ligase subunit beta [Buchnera aphidicola]|uniref:phenylalanine--tRNA ligase subunit beta n=1 Tax=Buchnera aphidicola TaxID=9 RepID=UPI0031B85383